ncbi:ABC transporter ATP-binding protein [Oceanobacillus kimchii]|uniref:ABC transporter ATP-binding protein n=1 Tax=Oceanobacillus kimchii TaxID=746691 RepID=UPI00158919A8|nr:ABC transporter ATP-binding protein [Oceanobacillus kimchii]
MKAIQVIELNKTLNSKKIINNINFTVEQGEIYGLLGPNGAGKTTIMKQIVGLLSIDSGDILINNCSVKNNFEQAMNNIGGIIESPDMYEYMTGMDNLIHYARMSNTKHTPLAEINSIVKRIGLESAINNKVKTYSLGMKQRLGIGQALLNNPSVLILDEPTNGLDPKGNKEMRQYLLSIAKSAGISILISSHILSELEGLCDKVAIFNQGKLLKQYNLNDNKEINNSVKVKFILDGLKDIKKLFSNYKILELKEDYIILRTTNDEIPKLVEKIVLEGYKLYNMEIEKKTLEDLFMETIELEGDIH